MFKISKKIYFIVFCITLSHADFLDTSTSIYSAKCTNGNSESCVYLGKSYRYGNISNTKGFEKYKKLSEEGIDDPISNSIYADEKRDNFKAFNSFKQACDQNNALGCYYVGLSYFYGDGVRKNLEESFKFYNKSCENNNSNGCNALGELYQKGKGTKQDLKKAKEFYGKACDLQLEEGCKNSFSTIAKKVFFIISC